MVFILNLYNESLDLNNQDDRKLFKVSYNGLDAKDAFDGKKLNYTKFTKLIEKDFNNIRVMSTLKVATKWPATGRRPEQNKMVDIFHSNKLSKEVVVEHVDLVWENTAFGAGR